VVVNGSLLYDGLMRDMPVVDYLAAGSGTTRLNYEITAYLDTSVGNDYQNRDLIADFYWWVEGSDVENLGPLPATGDDFKMIIWAAVVVVSLITGVVLWRNARRKEVRHGR